MNKFGRYTTKKEDESYDYDKNMIGEAMDRLGCYEDAEEQGLLHIAPYNDGTEIFYIADRDFMDFEKMIFATSYLHGLTEYAHGELGIGWFLTRAEAEQALKGMEVTL